MTNIVSTTANGTYGAGAVITIDITFSKAVDVTGVPTLALNDGGTASYSSGNGTSTLVFTYTVASGQSTPKLDSSSSSALTGTITDTVAHDPNAAVLTVPTGASTGALAANSSIAIDAVAPTVTNIVSTTANGTYGAGAVITIDITFSKAVDVTGVPTLALNDGGTASYSSGNGTSTLVFTYTVASGQSTPKLDSSSSSALTGTITDTVANDPNAAVLTVPTGSSTGALAANSSIAIDAVAPTVTDVHSTTADGTYGAGAVITIVVDWSKNVVVTGTPELALNSGGTATYASGSGTSELTFTYTVGSGDSSSKLDYTSTGALSLNGGTIFDTVTNPNAADLTLAAPGAAGSISATSSIVIDTTVASVTTVSSTTASGSYGVGSSITVVVDFSGPVDVTGTPLLALNSGGTASYVSGSGSSTLVFSYTVGAGQSANPLDELSTTALSLNGGTIDTVSNGDPALLNLPSPGSANSLSQSNIIVDTSAPTVTDVHSTTADGTYGAGAVITIVVDWSKNVVVTGTPELALNSGGTATYASGSGTSTLTFTYTVAAGQSSSKLDYTSTGALSLNGGTIFDTVTNPNAADLTLAAPGAAGSISATSSIVIDTTVASVTTVSSTTASGSYGVGSSITVVVDFSGPVDVTGTPLLALNSGGTASYVSGSGSSTLVFSYTVGAGQSANPLDELSTTALSLNGGTIDTVSNGDPALLNLPLPGSANSLSQSNIIVDTSAPTVTDVTSTTADGTYGAGAVITIVVDWSKNVVVTGTPELALNSGGTAAYVSGTGTSALTFTYTVGSGDSSSKLDYTSTGALSLNGGTIFDTVTNPNAADLTLAVPGATGSISATKSIAIDAIAPTVTNIVSTTANGTYGAGAVITIDITFSKAVDVTGVPTLALNDGGTASYVSGNGTSTLVFTYTVASGQSTPKLDSSSSSALSGTITDTVANDPNAAVLTVPTGASTGALAANSSIAIDAVAPTVTNIVSTTANGTYGAGAVITIDVTFSKAVDVTGVPTLALNDGGTASYSSGNGTSTLVFTYTVASGQSTPKLDSSSSSALSGTITDTVANDPNAAVLTVPTGASTGALAANSSIAIDAVAPTVTNIVSTTANGTYGAGAVITIDITFSKAVDVTGMPTLALNDGGTASYSSGNGTSTLVFTYTVASGQSTPKLDSSSSSALSGTITDTVANDPNAAVLTVPTGASTGALAANSSIAIDAIAPTVTNIVSTTANGTYGAGAVITIDITFSKAVDVTGAPTLALNDGGTASYSSGNGTSTLVFTYTVASGQSTPKLDSSSSSALSGTITDTVANDPNAAVLTVPTGASTGQLAANSSIAIDAVAPTVTNIVSTTANGTYGAGAVITIDITFSKAVDVTGVPTLALNDGGTASYVSGTERRRWCSRTRWRRVRARRSWIRARRRP